MNFRINFWIIAIALSCANYAMAEHEVNGPGPIRRPANENGPVYRGNDHFWSERAFIDPRNSAEVNRSLHNGNQRVYVVNDSNSTWLSSNDYMDRRGVSCNNGTCNLSNMNNRPMERSQWNDVTTDRGGNLNPVTGGMYKAEGLPLARYYYYYPSTGSTEATHRYYSALPQPIYAERVSQQNWHGERPSSYPKYNGNYSPRQWQGYAPPHQMGTFDGEARNYHSR